MPFTKPFSAGRRSKPSLHLAWSRDFSGIYLQLPVFREFFLWVFLEDPGRDSAFTYLRSTWQGAPQYEVRYVYAAPEGTQCAPALASHLPAKAAAFASHLFLSHFQTCST